MIKTLYTRFIGHFSKPIYFYSRPWLIISLNIILSALIMIFYEPFGYHFDSWAECTQLIGFTVIALFYSILFFLWIPRTSPMKRWMKNWTIGKNALYSFIFLLTTGLSISFYDFHLILQHAVVDYGTKVFYSCFLTDTIGVITIGVVPLCVGLLLERTYHLKKTIANYEQLKDSLIQQQDSVRFKESVAGSNVADGNENSEATITLTGDTKEYLEINPARILYLEASGNYVNIYYGEGKQGHKVIRTTFKSLEEQLAPYPYLVRCHRAYMVNTNFITQLDRNTQGYHLLLSHNREEIPVSRTYLKRLKEILSL